MRFDVPRKRLIHLACCVHVIDGTLRPNKPNICNVHVEAEVKPELSGSFEMINNDVDQEFSAGFNGTGKFD